LGTSHGFKFDFLYESLRSGHFEMISGNIRDKQNMKDKNWEATNTQNKCLRYEELYLVLWMGKRHVKS
jgi:hypothetical protein